jgi:type IV fimbrial biogenesis protein FimT
MKIQTRKMHGFTIVELMISVAVAAILCAVSAPALGSLIHTETTRASRNALVTSLNLARNMAVTGQSHVVVCPSSDQRTCSDGAWWQNGWIVFEDKNGDGQHNADERLIESVQTQSGMAILTSDARERVTYRGDGTSPGTNLTFTFCDRSGSKKASTVVVSNSGRPRQGGASSEQGAACTAGLPDRA